MTLAAPVAGNETRGVPWTGQPPVACTTARLMERQASDGVFAALNRYHRHQPEEDGKPQSYARRPQNPASPPVSAWPARNAETERDAPLPRLPQTPSLAFDGAALSETGAIPPDPMGAVGPAQYLMALNGRIRVFDKVTGAPGALNLDTDVFFSPVMTQKFGTFTSDPRVRYDRLTQRWFLVMIDVPGGATASSNRVMVAMSDGPVITETTVWKFWYFQLDQPLPAGDTGAFGDYPTLGIDANALYVGIDVFAQNGGYSTSAFVIRKSALLAGGPIVVTAFRNLTSGGEGPVTPQGVDNFDPNPAYGYFIGPSYAAFGRLVLRRIADAGGVPSISSNILITVPATAFPVTVPHKGNTIPTNGKLDASDDRLFCAVVRNGVLWTCHTIGVNSSGMASSSPTRDAARWYCLGSLDTTPSVLQSGTVYDAAASEPLYHFYPSVMVSGQGHVAMGLNSAGISAYINGAATGRLATDTAGTMRAVTPLTASNTAYNPPSDPGTADYGRRWGDYSYTSVDPDDDMTMWTIQQYCQAANSYTCRIVKLLAPPPATPVAANPAILTAGAAGVDVVVTGDTSDGAGFFDPGPGFSRHITASFSGTGLTVNSVTYVSPSQVRLNVNVGGGASGALAVTVTNPDGQSAMSATALVTVNSTFTQADVVTALQIAGGLVTATPANVLRLDLTGDGRVTLDDASAMLRRVTGG